MVETFQRIKGTFVLSAAFLMAMLPIIGESGAATSDQAQVNSGGGVTIKVTYLNPHGIDDLRFSVALYTLGRSGWI